MDEIIQGMSDSDLARNVEGAITEAFAVTSLDTGLRAGPAADVLRAEIMRLLFERQLDVTAEYVRRLKQA